MHSMREAITFNILPITFLVAGRALNIVESNQCQSLEIMDPSEAFLLMEKRF